MGTVHRRKANGEWFAAEITILKQAASPFPKRAPKPHVSQNVPGAFPWEAYRLPAAVVPHPNAKAQAMRPRTTAEEET